MLKLKELEHRVYSGKECVGFSYTVVDKTRTKDDPAHTCFKAEFERSNTNGCEWNMRVVLGRTRDADSQVYNFGYVMPRNGLPLELVAATGLKYFQLYLQEEIQCKNDYNFILGDLLKDM